MQSSHGFPAKRSAEKSALKTKPKISPAVPHPHEKNMTKKTLGKAPHRGRQVHIDTVLPWAERGLQFKLCAHTHTIILQNVFLKHTDTTLYSETFVQELETTFQALGPWKQNVVQYKNM